jgi:two-component system chemotaxis response regulator CheY
MVDYAEKVVLVVDDQSFLRNSLIKELVNLGFIEGKILEAENGNEALKLLKTTEDGGELQGLVDLILSDWNMPRMTGLELLKNVRNSNHSFKDVKFALVTTVSEKDKVIEALNFKLAGYIIKPVEPEKLKDLIESVFKE